MLGQKLWFKAFWKVSTPVKHLLHWRHHKQNLLSTSYTSYMLKLCTKTCSRIAIEWKSILKYLLSLFWLPYCQVQTRCSQNRDSKCFKIDFHSIATLELYLQPFPYYLIPNLFAYVFHFQSLFPSFKLQF